MRYRNLDVKDVDAIKEIIKEGAPYLGLNGHYTYWMIATLYSDYSFVAEEDDKLYGFVTAMPVPEKHAVFVWQLGVGMYARKHGIAYQLLEHVWSVATAQKLPGIITSIDAKNKGSLKSFEKLSKHHALSMKPIGKYDQDGFCEDVYLYSDCDCRINS